jgi:hypothetical protein
MRYVDVMSNWNANKAAGCIEAAFEDLNEAERLALYEGLVRGMVSAGVLVVFDRERCEIHDSDELSVSINGDTVQIEVRS